MSAATAPPQDLPPAGGYSKINYTRVPARRYFKGWQLITGAIVMKVAFITAYLRARRRYNYDIVENRSAHLAIQPIIFAERDRGMLIQCVKNRDIEAKLMADDPNWEVGKLDGEPIYKTVPKGTWFHPFEQEYFAHSTVKTRNEMVFFAVHHL